jgi:hypothetical protein
MNRKTSNTASALVRRMREQWDHISILGFTSAQLHLVTDPDGVRTARGDPLVKATVTRQVGGHARIRSLPHKVRNQFFDHNQTTEAKAPPVPAAPGALWR